MRIEIFNDIYDATTFIEVETEIHPLEHFPPYFKAEIFRLDDGRWRVGIMTEQQMELKV